MLLSALLAATGSSSSLQTPPSTATATATGDPEILRIAHDSRRVVPGDLFCCIKGRNSDGHLHAAEAVEAGAVAVLSERPVQVDGPVILTESVRSLMPHLASEVSGRPSESLDVVGVTGTNGKTSVVHLLNSVLDHAGRRPATIGTLTGAMTTPEAPDLQEQLALWVDEGRETVVMEVSSHALDQHRVDGVRFAATAFTNLSRDHLDYHISMEAYAAAKARLFTPEFTDRAVVVVDSDAGQRVANAAARAGLFVVEVSVVGLEPKVCIDSVTFRWRDLDVVVPVGGAFTVTNSVVAAELAVVLGVKPEVVVAGLAEVAPIPGRFEPVDVGTDYTVIVDYAHSPDSLAQLLDSARRVADGGRVISVLGCGGERDAGKRPEMGRVAELGADVVVVTSDNPRGEPPEGVIADILTGMTGQPAHINVDRRQAIHNAMALADAGDVVVISGKGHETVQSIAGQDRPFDDRSVAIEEAVHLGHGEDAETGAGQ
ncbi:MAG: UDP-N-acetylmuramoyl-L-alanyl-D-glutamate--2,6-diaminopimelate ligase [Acidimicrobiia bacterium]|nr:UDP-N-acetylmuramoyl-L-alanyl-D-glutamate--2,6-diaminopimelate ligase [Acidimicrobiia bacterium]